MSKIKGRNNFIILDNNNIQQFGDFFGLKAQSDYGLGSIKSVGAYVPPTSKTKSELLKEGFTAEEVPDMVVKLYIENQPRIIKYEENKKALYSFTLFHVSPESLIRIKGDAGFADAESKMCPLLLWQIIERTHRGSINSKCERINKNAIIMDYEQVKMGADENIVVYHDRFLYAAKNYHTIKKMDIKDKSNDIELAWAFFRSLNKNVYGEFIRHVENNLNSKTMDESIKFNDMYELAQSYSSLGKSNAKQSTHAVFAAGRIEKYSARLDADEVDDEEESNQWTKVVKETAPRTKPVKTPKPIESIKCFYCDNLGHYSSDCPAKKKANKEKAEKEKAEKSDANASH